MFPACTADHNCCGVAETFFGCCTSEEECAFEAARAGATAAWLAPSGCSAFAGCGVADGDDVRVIRSVEDAPAVCGLCLCGDPVGAATETVFTAAGSVASGDRKSTRLNSSHSQISYAVFCLKKKKEAQCAATATKQTLAISAWISRAATRCH